MGTAKKWRRQSSDVTAVMHAAMVSLFREWANAKKENTSYSNWRYKFMQRERQHSRMWVSCLDVKNNRARFAGPNFVEESEPRGTNCILQVYRCKSKLPILYFGLGTQESETQK